MADQKLESKLMVDDLVMLGHTFKPMTREDWDSFAGADEGSYICYCDGESTVLIWSPTAKVLHEMTYDFTNNAQQRDWTFKEGN